MRPGPYPEGTTPDQVFFRTVAPVDREARYHYEHAQAPWQTDRLNEEHIGKARLRVSPLGDPVPFSAYLIGQLVNPTGYDTQFNLDADRAYAYLTWDWVRYDSDDTEHRGRTDLGFDYPLPRVAPWLDTEHWNPATPQELTYVDKPPPEVVIELTHDHAHDHAHEGDPS
jgi:hypothetical protein